MEGSSDYRNSKNVWCTVKNVKQHRRCLKASSKHVHHGQHSESWMQMTERMHSIILHSFQMWFLKIQRNKVNPMVELNQWYGPQHREPNMKAKTWTFKTMQHFNCDAAPPKIQNKGTLSSHRLVQLPHSLGMVNKLLLQCTMQLWHKLCIHLGCDKKSPFGGKKRKASDHLRQSCNPSRCMDITNCFISKQK